MDSRNCDLKYISFTGADNHTDPEDLFVLAKTYPLAEFGILYYPKKFGSPRYPDPEWIQNFIDTKPKGFKCALHLCGPPADHFGEIVLRRTHLFETIREFGRVQLNFPTPWTLPRKRREALTLLEGIENFHFSRHSGEDPSVIIQVRKANAPLVDLIMSWSSASYPGIDLLYDSSGGKGKTLPEIHPAYPGRLTGYAGGISPENVREIVDRISTVAPGEEVWIDMESGIRTYDEFDLSKVRAVLEEVHP